MNTISTLLKNEKLPESGNALQSEFVKDNRTPVKRRELDWERKVTVFKFISSFLVILMGVAGYWIAELLF